MQVIDPKEINKIWNTEPVDRWALWLPIASAALGAVAGLLAWFNQGEAAAVSGVLAGAVSAAGVLVTSEASRRRDKQMAAYFDMLEFTQSRLPIGAI